MRTSIAMRHEVPRKLALAVLALTAIGVGRASFGRVFATPEKAVHEAFPDASIRKHTSYLTDEQAARISELAGSPPSSKIVIAWSASRKEHLLGTAYLESHVVRTLPETILVVVDPGGRVVKVEILSFDEPDDYLPRARWLEQFQGRALDADLALRKGLRGITGATISSRAIATAVRRILATDSLLRASPGAEASPARTPDPAPPGGAPATPSAPPAKKPAPSAASPAVPPS